MSDEVEATFNKLNWLMAVVLLVVLVIIIFIWWNFPASEESTPDINSHQVEALGKGHRIHLPGEIPIDPKVIQAKSFITARKHLGTVHEKGRIQASPADASYSHMPLLPEQVFAAYGSKKSPNGKGKKIAIIVCYNYGGIQGDLNAFCRLARLPAKKLFIHEMSTKTASDDGWAMEACLDTQYATLLAPEADIHVVFATSASLNDLRTAILYANKNIHPDVVSMSWGIDENIVAQYRLETMFEDLFVPNGKPGTIFMASSGDSFNVSYPSSSPNVVSVGGTTLNMIGNKRAGEVPWYEQDLTGSGKGLSAIFKKPPFQSTNLSNYRMTPDLSLMANTPNETGVTVVFKGDEYGVAGTSLSCPLFAGMTASGLSYNPNTISQGNLLTALYSRVCTDNPFNSAVSGIGAMNEEYINFLATLH